MSKAAKLRLLVVVGLVAGLEVCCRVGIIDPRVVIPPSEMVVALYNLIVTGKIFPDLVKTLSAVAIAFVIAVTAGLSLGIAIHALPRLRRALEPFFATYYAVPFFIFYPLLVAIFGISLLPVVVMGFAFAVVVVIIATLNALDRQPRILGKLGAVHRLNPVQTALLLRLPAAAPHFLTGIKLAIAYTFIGVIASEFLLSPAGIGYAISFAYGAFDNKTMYGLILFILLLVTTINTTLHMWEQRLVRQHGTAFRGSSIGRGRGAGKLFSFVDFALVIGVTVVIWQILHWMAGGDAIASPLATAKLLWNMPTDPIFLTHAESTLSSFLLALVFSLVGGIGIGVWLGVHKVSGEVGEPILVSLYSTPKVALFPVVLLIFGFGLSSKIAFGVLHGIIPITIFTMNAIRKIKPTYMKLGRVLNLSQRQKIATLIIPAVLPEMLAGLRVGFSLTLLGVLIAEMFASKSGLGYLVMHAIEINDLGYTLAIAVLLFTVAGVLNYALLAADRRFARQI